MGLGKEAFAKLDGCDKAVVIRAVRAGKLPTLSDGSIDPGLARTPWRKGNIGRDLSDPYSKPTPIGRPRKERPDITPEMSVPQVVQQIVPKNPTPIERQAAIELASGDTALMSYAEAQTAKENYIALLKRLEYDQARKLVVPVAEVMKEVSRAYAQVRTKILAIPSEQSARVSQCRDVNEIKELLTSLMVEALESLAV